MIYDAIENEEEVSSENEGKLFLSELSKSPEDDDEDDNRNGVKDIAGYDGGDNNNHSVGGSIRAFGISNLSHFVDPPPDWLLLSPPS